MQTKIVYESFISKIAGLTISTNFYLDWQSIRLGLLVLFYFRICKYNNQFMIKARDVFVLAITGYYHKLLYSIILFCYDPYVFSPLYDH
jgi:hypothetical protein